MLSCHPAKPLVELPVLPAATERRDQFIVEQRGIITRPETAQRLRGTFRRLGVQPLTNLPSFDQTRRLGILWRETQDRAPGLDIVKKLSGDHFVAAGRIRMQDEKIVHSLHDAEYFFMPHGSICFNKRKVLEINAGQAQRAVEAQADSDPGLIAPAIARKSGSIFRYPFSSSSAIPK